MTSKVVANMSMSLDGFIEDRDGGVGDLFAWYESGSRSTTMPGDEREFRTSEQSAEHLQTAVAETGAVVCGRRLFDLTHGWGGSHPVGAPVFVVTHELPDDWPHPDAPLTFITDGVQSAVEQARAAAGDKSVAIASADVGSQCLEAGLLDAIRVDLVPVLLGAGKPFFAGIGKHAKLADPEITRGRGVTHMHYRVLGEG